MQRSWGHQSHPCRFEEARGRGQVPFLSPLRSCCKDQQWRCPRGLLSQVGSRPENCLGRGLWYLHMIPTANSSSSEPRASRSSLGLWVKPGSGQSMGHGKRGGFQCIEGLAQRLRESNSHDQFPLYDGLPGALDKWPCFLHLISYKLEQEKNAHRHAAQVRPNSQPHPCTHETAPSRGYCINLYVLLRFEIFHTLILTF